MNGTKSRQLRTGICALAAVGLFAATQGCSSSNGGGTGGASGGGTGGKLGTGGGSGTGTGGSVVDSGPPLCTGTTWAGAPLITDFSDAMIPDGGTMYRIGTHGGLYTYPITSLTGVVTAGAYHVTGTVPAGVYAGAGIYFDDCINASASTGISFALTGSFGTCDMFSVGAQFPQFQPPPPDSGHGVCTGTGCYGPGAPFSVTTTSVTFAMMTGGGVVPTVTAEAQNRLTGVNFGFHGPAGSDAGGDASAGGCTVDFTIDNVRFTP